MTVRRLLGVGPAAAPVSYTHLLTASREHRERFGDALVEELVRGVAAVELVEHLAVADEEDAPGAARGLHGVRDHEDRLSAAVHLAEETEQLVRGFAVERAGRLVGEQDARLCDERAGNGGALLLAAGDLVGCLLYTSRCV